MLIRLLILSAFVLLVHLVVGMFARDLMHLQMHELTKRAAKDEGTDSTLNIMSRRRQLVMQQHTVKRAASPKTTRRQRDGDEELLHAEETSYSGALVKEGEENSTLSSNESKVVSVPPTNISSVTRDAKDDYKVDSSTESKETSSTPVVRKRRPVQRATEPSMVSSHLPIAAALTMSESLYNHFRPLDREVPEDQFLPFLHFGKKLVPNAKTTFPATVTSSTNALDSVTNSLRLREYSSFHPPVEAVYQASVTKPRPSEEEVNEDMDVAVVKPIIEKNKATRGKASSLLSLRNVGGLYRKQLETNENLVISSDKNLINDTGAKVNDTKDIERKRLLSVTPGKKEVIIDSNGRRKIVAVSRRPLITNITSAVIITTTTAPTTPLTNTSNDKAEASLLVNPLGATNLSATSSSTTSTTSQPTITSTTTTTTTTPSTISDSTASPVPTSISRTSTVTRAATTSTTANHSNSTSTASPSTVITTEQPTITSTTSTTSISPLTNATSASNMEHHLTPYLAHDPTQFSSSNVVAARTVPHRQFSRNSTTLTSRRRTSGLYNTGRRTNPLRASLLRHTSDNATELDMTPEESNVSSSFGSTTNNSTLAEDIKNQTTTRLPSIIEKYQQMRMADVRAGRRQLRQNYTDILRLNTQVHSVESDGALMNDSQRTSKNTSDSMETATRVSIITTVTPPLNLSSSSDVTDEEILSVSTSSERPTTTSSLLIPTTKILSTAVVTSVSIKGAWPSGVTEMPSQEEFPVPPQEKDAAFLVPDQKESDLRAQSNVSSSRPENFADEKLNLTIVSPTAPGNATYSMIKDLLAGMNASEVQTDTQSSSIGENFENVTNVSGTEIRLNNTAGSVKEVLPLSHEHFVGVDSPRPVFTNSSVVYTTSYSRKESPPIQRSPSFQPTLENVNATSLPIVSTTTSTTTGSSVPHITVSSISSTTIPPIQINSAAIEVSQSTSSSSQSPTPNIEIVPVNTSIYQQDDPPSSLETEQNLSKGRALWLNTTSRPSTNIPLVQSSDKDFDLPLVKLYNASTVWGDAVRPTEETSYNEAPYETVMKVDEEYIVPNNQTGQYFNETAVNVDKCNGSDGCSENERHTSTTRRPHITKACEGLNTTREGCGPRPRESSVSVAESTSSLEMAIYVLAGICVIPAVIGALFLVRCILRHRRKVLDESDTCSEISCHRAGENGEATTPASTKLPRLQPHMGWEQEKSPTSPPAVPDTNNRWEFPRSMLRLQTVLGQGNFGQVLKAEADDLNGHPGTTRLVAVKLVKEGATTREKEDLLRELEIMKQLGAHPNVVTLLGCCTEHEPYLLIMEYVMYGKLLTFLRDHRTRQNYYNFSEDSDALTSRDLTVFGYCVARGMEYLVSKGIIHRDLAARNVLVDHNKLCKIADFGMSRSVRELGEIYEQRQTKGALPIRWMAPESLLYRVFTHKSDVWSFGILMWEIVTLGSTPYPTMGAREVMKRVREGYRLERPSHCRPELFRVISHCWNSDPAKRPDFSELKRELGSLVEDAREGKYVDLDRFAEYSGGRTTTLHSGGEPELIHM